MPRHKLSQVFCITIKCQWWLLYTSIIYYSCQPPLRPPPSPTVFLLKRNFDSKLRLSGNFIIHVVTKLKTNTGTQNMLGIAFVWPCLVI